MDDQNDGLPSNLLDAQNNNFTLSFTDQPDIFTFGSEQYLCPTSHNVQDDFCGVDQRFGYSDAMNNGRKHEPVPHQAHARSLSNVEQSLPMRPHSVSTLPVAQNSINQSMPYNTFPNDMAMPSDLDFSSMVHSQPSPAAKDDNCASPDCSSNCGDCPSQCGASEAGDICRDFECVPACNNAECKGATSPCTDIDCVARSMDDTDKAAADVLVSFPLGQAQMASSPLSSMPSSQLFPGQGSFHNMHSGGIHQGGVPSATPTPSLSVSNPFASGDMFHNSFEDMNMGYENTDWMALSNHIVQSHCQGYGGLGCVRPCLLDFSGASLPFDRCPLPVHSHTHPGLQSFCPVQNSDPLHPDTCGVELGTTAAFLEHLCQQHPCVPDQHAEAQAILQPATPSNMVHVDRHSFMHQRSPTAFDDALATSPSTVSHYKTPMSGSSRPETPNTAATEASGKYFISKAEQFICKWQSGENNHVCGFVFQNDEDLQNHCRENHLKPLVKRVGGNGQAGFRCRWEECARQEDFTQKSKLERHLQTHTGFKPVKCNVCGIALSAKQSLAQHMRIHTGEKPWVCREPGCKASFKQQSALTMHMRTHTGEKPLQCDVCGKKFGESSNLSKHRKTHNVKGQFKCDYCEKDFHRLDQKRRHMKVHEKDRNRDGEGSILVAMSPDNNPQPIRRVDAGRVTKGSSRR